MAYICNNPSLFSSQEQIDIVNETKHTDLQLCVNEKGYIVFFADGGIRAEEGDTLDIHVVLRHDGAGQATVRFNDARAKPRDQHRKVMRELLDRQI